jgi:hypothetical protein
MRKKRSKEISGDESVKNPMLYLKAKSSETDKLREKKRNL